MTFPATDSIFASLAGIGTTLTLAQTQPMNGNDPWSLISYLPAVLGPLLVVVVNRFLSVQAAKKRVHAELKDELAAKYEKDKDPSNDAKAKELRTEARIERAEADALEKKQ